MISPEEKAKELLSKMDVIHYHKLITQPQCKGLPVSMHDDQIKQCALVAVDEIISIYQYANSFKAKQREYWENVKQELEKL